jgi:hypothetical protein
MYFAKIYELSFVSRLISFTPNTPSFSFTFHEYGFELMFLSPPTGLDLISAAIAHKICYGPNIFTDILTCHIQWVENQANLTGVDIPTPAKLSGLAGFGKLLSVLFKNLLAQCTSKFRSTDRSKKSEGYRWSLSYLPTEHANSTNLGSEYISGSQVNQASRSDDGFINLSPGDPSRIFGRLQREVNNWPEDASPAQPRQLPGNFHAVDLDNDSLNSFIANEGSHLPPRIIPEETLNEITNTTPDCKVPTSIEERYPLTNLTHYILRTVKKQTERLRPELDPLEGD